MESVFSQSERSDSSAKGHSEKLFPFLDRSARPEVERIRSLIEQWFSHLPEEDAEELLPRLRSPEDFTFHSAFLELWTHELLISTGHSVEFHPATATTKRPVFKATAPDGSAAFYECVVSTEMSEAERAHEALMNAVKQTIEKIDSPDYFLTLSTRGTAAAPLPGKRWRKEIEEWLGTLDHESVRLGQEQPELHLPHEGLEVTIGVLAKGQSRGKPNTPSIGAEVVGVTAIRSGERICASLKKKASRYGKLDSPYIIVVNCMGLGADSEEIEAAILGEEGLWPPTKDAHTRVSCVLALLQLLPWSIPKVTPRLFFNPNASAPYSGPLTGLPSAETESTAVSYSDGLQPRDLFRLAEKWPREDSQANRDTIRLWSWHKPEFSLIDGQVDWDKSDHYLDDESRQAAYKRLRDELGTDQIVWCCLNRDDWPDRSGLAEWELDVPREEVLAIVDEGIWNHQWCQFDASLAASHRRILMQECLDEGVHEPQARQECLARKFDEYKRREGPLRLSSENDAPAVNVLLRHPVDPKWVIKDGRNDVQS